MPVPGSCNPQESEPRVEARCGRLLTLNAENFSMILVLGFG